MGRAKANLFIARPLGPWEGSKGQISFTLSIMIFISNCVCVLTNKGYKTYQTDFHSIAWVMPQGWDFGALGVPMHGVQYFFFKHGLLAYKIDGENRMQIKLSS